MFCGVFIRFLEAFKIPIRRTNRPQVSRADLLIQVLNDCTGGDAWIISMQQKQINIIGL